MDKFFLIVLILTLTACVSPEKIAAYKAIEESENEILITARRDVEEIRCSSKAQCDKIFRIASDVVSTMSDMKLQISSENIVSTYNPISIGYVGMSATRSLGMNEAEIIKLNVNCKGMNDGISRRHCMSKVLNIYRDYKSKIHAIVGGNVIKSADSVQTLNSSLNGTQVKKELNDSTNLKTEDDETRINAVNLMAKTYCNAAAKDTKKVNQLGAVNTYNANCNDGMIEFKCEFGDRIWVEKLGGREVPFTVLRGKTHTQPACWR